MTNPPGALEVSINDSGFLELGSLEFGYLPEQTWTLARLNRIQELEDSGVNEEGVNESAEAGWQKWDLRM